MSDVHPVSAELSKDEMTIDLALNIINRMRFFLGRGMAFITDAPSSEIAAWQYSFAIGSDNCIGHTMTSKAQEIGCTTACLSKGATKVCRMLDLPPSPWMLDEGARESYRTLRRDQEKERNAQSRNKRSVSR
jgi:hypothetical protein